MAAMATRRHGDTATRRLAAGVVLALIAGCGGGSKSEQPILPLTVAEVWRLKDSRETPMQGRGRIIEGDYEGPGTIHAQIHDLPSSGMALDVAQKWRQLPDTVSFYHDHYFVVVRWENADRDALKRFVREMEKHLGFQTAPR